MKKLFTLPVCFLMLSAMASAAGKEDISSQTVFVKTTDLNGAISFAEKTSAAPRQMQIKNVVANEASTQYSVKVIVDPDDNGQNKIPQGVWLIKDELVSYQSMRKDVNEFYVPAGEYLVQVIFTNNDDAGKILFIPNVIVDGDKEIHVNASMADKKITTQFILPNGEKATLPESNGMGGATDTPYNIKTITADIHVTYNGLSKGSLQTLIGLGGASYSDLLTVSTNVADANGEVSYVVKAVAPGSNGDNYMYLCSTTMDKAGQSTVLSNDPQQFHKLNTSNIARTPAYPLYGNNNDVHSVDFFAYNAESSFVGGLSTDVNSMTDVYVCTPAIDFSGLHARTRIYTNDLYDDEEWMYAGVISPFFAFGQDGIEYYAMQDYNSYNLNKPEWEKLPVNPSLTFKGNQNIEFGSNFAVCVTAVQYDPWADVPYSYVAPDCYYGNYGEYRDIDLYLYDSAVKYNGVEQDLGGLSIDEWSQAWATNGHAPGVMHYTFTNDNVVFDGVRGKNICEVSITEEAADAEAPTLQRIMMRDAAGNVTNKFESAEGATLMLVGGDFVKHEQTVDLGEYPMDFTYYTLAEADFVAEYAPHGTTDFLPLNLTTETDKLFMPGFGYHLSAALDQVTEKSENGLYDLRVKLTDKAGNFQSQIISPAFKVTSLAGVDEIIDDNNTELSVENGSIVSADGARVQVYNLTGAAVQNNNLSSGVYIAKTADKCAKILVK